MSVIGRFMHGLTLAVLVGFLGACASVSDDATEWYAPTIMSTRPQPGELYARFFGTTTIYVSDGTTSIMVDGFFSRPSIFDILLGFGKIGPNPDRIEGALKLGEIDKITAVLVSHSHHDHAMDAPYVAEKYKAQLVGSESTGNIAAGSIPPPKFHLIRDAKPWPEGTTFNVSAFKSAHGNHQWKWLAKRLSGSIGEGFETPANVFDYKLGGNYNFLLQHEKANVLVVPSANVPLNLKGAKADIVFLSIGNLDLLSNANAKAYWKEAIKDTGAKLVIPVHWDSFFRSLEKGLKPVADWLDNTPCAMETVRYLAARDHVKIGFMPLYQPVVLTREGAELVPRTAGGDIPDPFHQGCRKSRPEGDRGHAHHE